MNISPFQQLRDFDAKGMLQYAQNIENERNNALDRFRKKRDQDSKLPLPERNLTEDNFPYNTQNSSPAYQNYIKESMRQEKDSTFIYRDRENKQVKLNKSGSKIVSANLLKNFLLTGSKGTGKNATVSDFYLGFSDFIKNYPSSEITFSNLDKNYDNGENSRNFSEHLSNVKGHLIDYFINSYEGHRLKNLSEEVPINKNIWKILEEESEQDDFSSKILGKGTKNSIPLYLIRNSLDEAKELRQALEDKEVLKQNRKKIPFLAQNYINNYNLNLADQIVDDARALEKSLLEQGSDAIRSGISSVVNSLEGEEIEKINISHDVLAYVSLIENGFDASIDDDGNIVVLDENKQEHKLNSSFISQYIEPLWESKFEIIGSIIGATTAAPLSVPTAGGASVIGALVGIGAGKSFDLANARSNFKISSSGISIEPSPYQQTLNKIGAYIKENRPNLLKKDDEENNKEINNIAFWQSYKDHIIPYEFAGAQTVADSVNILSTMAEDLMGAKLIDYLFKGTKNIRKETFNYLKETLFDTFSKEDALALKLFLDAKDSFKELPAKFANIVGNKFKTALAYFDPVALKYINTKDILKAARNTPTANLGKDEKRFSKILKNVKRQTLRQTAETIFKNPGMLNSIKEQIQIFAHDRSKIKDLGITSSSLLKQYLDELSGFFSEQLIKNSDGVEHSLGIVKVTDTLADTLRIYSDEITANKNSISSILKNKKNYLEGVEDLNFVELDLNKLKNLGNTYVNDAEGMATFNSFMNFLSVNNLNKNASTEILKLPLDDMLDVYKIFKNSSIENNNLTDIPSVFDHINDKVIQRVDRVKKSLIPEIQEGFSLSADNYLSSKDKFRELFNTLNEIPSKVTKKLLKQETLQHSDIVKILQFLIPYNIKNPSNYKRLISQVPPSKIANIEKAMIEDSFFKIFSKNGQLDDYIIDIENLGSDNLFRSSIQNIDPKKISSNFKRINNVLNTLTFISPEGKFLQKELSSIYNNMHSLSILGELNTYTTPEYTNLATAYLSFILRYTVTLSLNALKSGAEYVSANSLGIPGISKLTKDLELTKTGIYHSMGKYLREIVEADSKVFKSTSLRSKLEGKLNENNNQDVFKEVFNSISQPVKLSKDPVTGLFNQVSIPDNKSKDIAFSNLDSLNNLWGMYKRKNKNFPLGKGNDYIKTYQEFIDLMKTGYLNPASQERNLISSLIKEYKKERKHKTDFFVLGDGSFIPLDLSE